MNVKDFLGYAMGTAFVVAIAVTAVLGLILLIGAIPLMLLLFPLTAAAVGAVMLVGYLRHRHRRR